VRIIRVPRCQIFSHRESLAPVLQRAAGVSLLLQNAANAVHARRQMDLALWDGRICGNQSTAQLRGTDVFGERPIEIAALAEQAGVRVGRDHPFVLKLLVV